MEDAVDLAAIRQRMRGLAESMSALADREDLVTQLLEAAERRDPAAIRSALRELPGDPIGGHQCLHFLLVTNPEEVPVFDVVCRWACGIHSGDEVAQDGTVELSGGRPARLWPDAIAVLKDIGVISCQVGLVGIDRQDLMAWQEACGRPDYS